jgi:hypothetical protein
MARAARTKSSKAAAPVKPVVEPVANSHDDRRRLRRRVVVWKARLVAGTHKFSCWVRNLSSGGMMIQLDLPLAIHSPVTIETERFGNFDGFIAWSSESLHGIVFVESAETIRARFGDEGAKFGLDLPPSA